MNTCPRPIKNVLVMGGATGRIGRGIACKLSGRVRVFAHGRDPAGVALANSQGIDLYVADELVRMGGPAGVPVTFVCDPSDFPSMDETLVISATTSDSVLRSLQHVPDAARIMTLENGWNTPSQVRAHNPTWEVSGGVAWFSCKAHPSLAGYDRVTPGGYIAAEPSSERAARELREVWGDDSVVSLVFQGAPEKRKTITNSMFNGPGIIFDRNLGAVLGTPGYKAFMRAMCREGKAAANAAGCDVGSESELFEMAYAIAAKNADDHTSAYAMMSKGLATEISTMNGAIARDASSHGTQAPLNSLIASFVARMTEWRKATGSMNEVFAEHASELAAWRARLLAGGEGFSDSHATQTVDASIAA